jgi:LacI family transcriptional regulator
LSVSRRKLELDFARQLRRTPKEEITRVRIERAKLLLAETELAVPLVGERCGFNYPERFTIAFRRSVGLTPMAFRRSMQSRPGGPRDSGYRPVSGGTL